MKQIVTCKEMKALDGNMIEGIGIPSVQVCIWWGIRTTGLWKCSVSWILQLPVRCRL